MNLCIVNRYGLVHRAEGRCCGAVTAALRRVRVTPLQVRVWQLPSCGLCFEGDEFQRMVRAS